jgi:hypothetical protein
MKIQTLFKLTISLGLALAVAACDDDEAAEITPDGSTTTADASTAADASTTADAATAPDAAPDQGSTGDAGACDDPSALAQEAMTSGTQILDGVSMETSTPIATILGAPTTYEGQTLRIEGQIVEICQTQGCYATLDDGTGNHLNLKVTDGVVDLRQYMTLGQYAVGQGIFNAAGGHGAQVKIDEGGGGAMVGTVTCPLPQ